MDALRFEVPIDNLPGVRADAAMGNTFFEVLVEPRDARRLRAALIDAARIASHAHTHRVVLLLEEPHITDRRLKAEWDATASVVRPELFARLSLVVRRAGQWSGYPGAPATDAHALLDEVIGHGVSRQPARSTRGSEAHYEILRILMHHWLLGKGPIAISSLMEISGTSHPTVARAIDRLAYCLKRHSDRSVELRFFPRDEWARLVALADEVRGTVRFVDQSGQPRAPESLLRRLQRLQRQDIAVGGVWGAKHYHAALDLVGNPRLDLSLHASGKVTELGFVERLDPALALMTRRDQAPSLVVHVVRRAASLFERDGSGGLWADPVECLLDLHEARLEDQALEFLRSFPAAKSMSQ